MKKEYNNELLNPTEDVSVEDFAAAHYQLHELKKEQGLLPEEKGLTRLISWFFNYRENRQKACVNKKKILWLAVLLGAFGAHRFYSKRYILGTLYLLFCWSGVPTAMTIIDLVELIPVPADENGNIYV